jgi:hypothetical protein
MPTRCDIDARTPERMLSESSNSLQEVTMSQPPPLNYATPSANPIDLRGIAMRQRGIMICILAYIVMFLLQFVLPDLRTIFGLLAFAASVTGAVFVFMLSLKLYSVGVGIVLGILTLIPILGLLVLLIINGKATKILRSYNIRVGLLGADPNAIPSAGQLPQ